jgi:hypothetical protein
MTAQNYFAAKQNLEKAPAKQVQFGGNIGGPIIKDKLHFFANLERIDQNRGVTMNMPARPELNFSDFTHDNVWNWMVRMDHQINGGNTWAVRYCARPRRSRTSSRCYQLDQVTRREGDRHGLFDRRHAELRDQEHARQFVEALMHEGRRVLRQPGYFDTGDQAALAPDCCSRPIATASARARQPAHGSGYQFR